MKEKRVKLNAPEHHLSLVQGLRERRKPEEKRREEKGRGFHVMYTF